MNGIAPAQGAPRDLAHSCTAGQHAAVYLCHHRRASAPPSPTTIKGAQIAGWAFAGSDLSPINASMARRSASAQLAINKEVKHEQVPAYSMCIRAAFVVCIR